MNDKDFYRIARYIALILHENQQTQTLLANKFNFEVPIQRDLQDILKKVCEDFGLPYDQVITHSGSAKTK